MKQNRHIKNLLGLLPALISAVLAMVVFCSCRIEPPLRLADNENVEMMLPELETDLKIIWGGIDTDEWWYGWDDTDDKLFGELDYPEPLSYEIRLYYFGDDPSASWLNRNTLTINGNRFRKAYYFGYHDMLIWSNIYSPDHAQVVLIDESDLDNVTASTTETRLRSRISERSDYSVFNGPEIFYSGLLPKLLVTKNPADYDYFDEENNVWVKHLDMEVSPMVYTYLVQVVIYNNKGRIVGIDDRTTVSSVARGVSLHSGKTSKDDAVICFDMRMKQSRKARGGRDADIIGGKMTTFGLCDMEPWIRSRADSHYAGSRTDLLNRMGVDLRFNNNTHSVFNYDVTSQMRRQAHGGVITIEIDADTITVPTPSDGGPSAGFDPWINGYDDEVTHEFDM